jgi:hypothetical protein
MHNVTPQRNLLDEPEAKLFPNELTRLPYLARTVIWLVVVGVVAALLVPIPFFGRFVAILWVLGVSVYRIVGLDIPRVRNIGLSPWLLWLYLVPLLNIVLFGALLFAPPKDY